ncbi:MAG: protein BatD [Saprospiraceae bacterium]|nr:protein BatD [Saprospiraceae bacterium]MBP9208813.1 protein BatD [Saprospiraceae bacterium]
MTRWLWLLFLLAGADAAAAQDVRFVAETNAQRVLEGSTFRVSFRLFQAEGQRFHAPDFGPFQVVSGPSRSLQSSIVNGRHSSSQAYVYVLQAKRSGRFSLSPARILANGNWYQTQPIHLEVVKARDEPSGAPDIFVKAEIDKKEAYAGEQCLLTYTLYTRVGIEDIEAGSRPSLDAFHTFPVNLLHRPTLREVYQGREYYLRVLSRTAIFPIRTGKLEIEPIVYRVVRGEEDPFGLNLHAFFHRQIENVASNPVYLEVKELPRPAPEHFSGAVGRMHLEMDTPAVRYSLNDAILLRFRISGNAHFKGMKVDLVERDSSFELTESRMSDIFKLHDEPIYEQACSWEYLLIPKLPGSFVVRPSFVYFDPDEAQYRSLGDSLHIEIAETGTGTGRKEDLLPKPMPPSRLPYPGPFLTAHPGFYLFSALPFAVLGIGILLKSGRRVLRRRKGGLAQAKGDSGPDVLLSEFMRIASEFTCLHDHDGKLYSLKAALQKELPSERARALLQWLADYELAKYSGALNEERISALASALGSVQSGGNGRI